MKIFFLALVVAGLLIAGCVNQPTDSTNPLATIKPSVTVRPAATISPTPGPNQNVLEITTNSPEEYLEISATPGFELDLNDSRNEEIMYKLQNPLGYQVKFTLYRPDGAVASTKTQLVGTGGIRPLNFYGYQYDQLGEYRLTAESDDQAFYARGLTFKVGLDRVLDLIIKEQIGEFAVKPYSIRREEVQDGDGYPKGASIEYTKSDSNYTASIEDYGSSKRASETVTHWEEQDYWKPFGDYQQVNGQKIYVQNFEGPDGGFFHAQWASGNYTIDVSSYGRTYGTDVMPLIAAYQQKYPSSLN